ncbi:hypothetical protein ELQ92_03600 [Labedella populi]|uniref:Immunity protein 52 domain-containing protein n=1 Tax=Labedella populi TaxID=2498850 RepID=A0A444QFJ8_9MICO|nr:Imm52 family immunity protein [Labedella populi]RWZ68315.1 hypothetical protein ELQ92_03600 [Labedella populi]
MTTHTTTRWGLLFQAFWGARAEAPAAIAARLTSTLDALDGFRAAIDGRWTDDSGNDVSADPLAVEELVSRSVPRSIEGKTFPKQGFGITLILVPGGQSAFDARATLRLEVTAGSALVPKHSFFNSVFVDGTSLFPEQETYSLWDAAFAGLVAAWQPEHAALLSKEQRQVNESVLPPDIDVPWVGALTYLSDRAGAFPETPASARMESTADGAVLSLTPDSPTDAVSGRSAREVLDRAVAGGWNARIPRSSEHPSGQRPD